ncbi:hypothetical protein [Mesorhizobium sp. M8A.F.Ca.ET.165.01.1.1]|uniref:hypothetical protein n=1 Tax=Mesorhizobium sp. M8A.F.Ca.ET.165.01.1.1 TaxID=2563960 RepID=UPI001093C726|nr:hypothetical protein [Mesorhizobium sp. M8A.F.Ca.ET.165.01.1.1]TGT34948.1 hypothetical protein EN808_34995 [Mesorhizobium sp. M8A.F.Ca.ET.165.01.1.1]
MAFAAFQTNAFQNNAFQTVAQIPLNPADPGRAGYYRRPLKYVRDGKIVDLNETEAPTVDEIVGSFELTPAILAALAAFFPDQPSPLPGKVGALDAKLGHIMIEREIASMADDDAIQLLLLA